VKTTVVIATHGLTKELKLKTRKTEITRSFYAPLLRSPAAHPNIALRAKITKEKLPDEQ